MKVIKVNILSVIYAFLFFTVLQLFVNVLRISRLTNLETNITYVLVFISILVSITIFSFLVYQYIKKSFDKVKGIQWSTILWFPYTIIFLYLFSLIIPEMNRGETASAGSGFIIIGMVIAYPIYIFLLNLYSKNNSEYNV